VRQLLEQRQVPLSLRAGSAGLDREVRWAHASDLADPWQYLARNEALLTNGTGMTADPDAQARFVARLERAGASALGYGLETGPPLTDAAVEEADRVGLPLFTLSRQARFSALAQLVAEANATQERRELQQVARLYEILHVALAAHAGTAEVLAELGYTPEEIEKLGAFARAMGLDWGGLDVLRDRRTGRLYVVDVNKTDMPPIALPWADKLRATSRLAAALRQLITTEETPT